MLRGGEHFREDCGIGCQVVFINVDDKLVVDGSGV